MDLNSDGDFEPDVSGSAMDTVKTLLHRLPKQYGNR